MKIKEVMTPNPICCVPGGYGPASRKHHARSQCRFHTGGRGPAITQASRNRHGSGSMLLGTCSGFGSEDHADREACNPASGDVSRW
jgi:hypothetical protein